MYTLEIFPSTLTCMSVSYPSDFLDYKMAYRIIVWVLFLGVYYDPSTSRTLYKRSTLVSTSNA